MHMFTDSDVLSYGVPIDTKGLCKRTTAGAVGARLCYYIKKYIQTHLI